MNSKFLIVLLQFRDIKHFTNVMNCLLICNICRTPHKLCQVTV